MCNFATKRKINLFINQKLVLMKIFNKFMVLAAAVLLGFGWASAEVVENYTVDFNTAISTEAHDFKIGTGWGHNVMPYASNEYVSYTYSETGGVDGSGALQIGTQVLGYSSWQNDLLVTPPITGTMTIKVKATSNPGTSGTGIKIWPVTRQGNKYTTGDIIVNETGSSGVITNTDDWYTITVSDLDNTMLGIACSRVIIDDLQVDGSAVIELDKALTITNVVSSVPTSGDLNCDSNNDYSFTYTITVKNTGEVDFAGNEENLSVSIVKYNDTDVALATTPLNQPLAIGESATVDVTLTQNYADNNQRLRYDAKENMSNGTYTVTPWVEPIPYLPNITVRDENSNDMVSYPNYATTFGAFGMVNEATSKTMLVRNSGAAPGAITITVPDGFTAEPATFTAEANTTTNVAITLLANEVGVKGGDMVVKCGDEAVATIALSGTVLDESKWFVNFEDQAIPAGCIVENNAWYVNTDSKTISDDNKRYLCSQSRNLNKFITPLLKVTEGEKMSFDVGRISGSTADDILLNVYYSTDRENWTLITTVPSADLPTTTNSGYNRQYKPLTKVLEGIPAGNVYLAFEAGYVYIDNLYGFELVPVDHDVIIKSINIPATGKQNNGYTATVTLQNLLDQEESCAASFVLGSQAALMSPVEIGALETKVVEFTLVPNVPGEWEAMASFTWEDDYEVATDIINVTIAEETAESLVEVTAEGSAKTSTSNAPLNLNYNNSETVSIYNATQLGLAAGAEITSITWKGYKTADTHTTHVTVWVENTEVELVQTNDEINKDAMTMVYDGPYTFEKGGSSSDMIEMLKINFAEPFAYTGNSLRVVVRSTKIEDTYKYVSFESFSYENPATQCIGRQTDTGDENNTSSLDGLSWSTRNYLPVITLGVKMEPATVSGVVTDEEGNPLEGVYIEAESVEAAPAGDGAPRLAATAGPVAYQTVTDADGVYTLPIIQTDKQYNITYSLDGYNDEVIENVDLSNGAITQNVTLTREMFAIEIDCGENGSAETNPADEAAAGTDVVLTVTPDNGYVIDQIMVLDSDEEEIDLIPGTTLNTFTFEMPMDDVLIVVTFKLDEATGVDDLNAASIKGVKYYNVAGVASDKPFDGMNIVVTRNADGSVKVQKVMF